MKICITGAASTVARKVIEVLEKDHTLTLVDIKYPDDFPSKSRKLTGSVLDRAFIKSVLESQDAVIHMAIASDGAEEIDGEMWEINVGGTLIMAQEAVAVKVKKFIYTSSLSVFDGYDNFATFPNLTENTPPKQKTFYGFTKYCGEFITKFYAENYQMKSVTLRLIAVVPEPPLSSWAGSAPQEIQTSARDVAWAFKLVVEKELEPFFDIFHVTGGHPKNPWSYEKIKRVLGYTPSNR
ncbi:MAG: NAD(P)-dependent oxidoreductase [Candidatus Jorgensenbacteria bacterium]